MAEYLASIYGTEKDKYVLKYLFISFYSISFKKKKKKRKGNGTNNMKMK